MGCTEYPSPVRSHLCYRMVTTVHFVIFLATTVNSLVILEQQTPDYCNVDEITRQNTRQPCTRDSDCLSGEGCQIGNNFAFCFNQTHFYKIGCPCHTHETVQRLAIQAEIL